MPLVDGVMRVCRRLEAVGWREYLMHISDLDIGQESAGSLAREMSRPLQRIDRRAPGFRDFCH